MSALLHRNIVPLASEMLGHFPALIIEGARQVGKSTLAREVASEGAKLLNLDDEQTRAAAIADPAGFVRQAGDKQLILDELQRLPELTLAVKSAIDENRRPGRFIITGSASLLRVRGLSDSLAG
ncbi:MAG: AAA family ATPase, partial [Cellulomonadaceae bacterium]|nr:AAA family ATPase [Cellulomonadaceae bacterium]